jgi:hypothetical protein
LGGLRRKGVDLFFQRFLTGDSGACKQRAGVVQGSQYLQNTYALALGAGGFKLTGALHKGQQGLTYGVVLLGGGKIQPLVQGLVQCRGRRAPVVGKIEPNPGQRAVILHGEVQIAEALHQQGLFAGADDSGIVQGERAVHVREAFGLDGHCFFVRSGAQAKAFKGHAGLERRHGKAGSILKQAFGGR